MKLNYTALNEDEIFVGPEDVSRKSKEFDTKAFNKTNDMGMGK